MTPVYAEGLSDADFSSMLEKLLAVLFTFASSGSGWLLIEKILRVYIKFAKTGRPAALPISTYRHIYKNANLSSSYRPYRQQLFHLQLCRSFLSKEQQF